MITLNLAAPKKSHQVIKEYLENNVSEILADKINNGVRIEKDGKTLINRKDLITFMDYAYREAQKQSEKGTREACCGEDVVFGWAVHYFEENSIEGKLHNEDGTEYKPPKPVYKPAPASTHIPISAPKPKPQMSLFDAQCQIAIPDEQESEATDEPDEDITDESENDTDAPEDNEPDDAPEQKTPRYIAQIGENRYVDGDGVVYSDIKDNPPVNTEMSALFKILGGALKVG